MTQHDRSHNLRPITDRQRQPNIDADISTSTLTGVEYGRTVQYALMPFLLSGERRGSIFTVCSRTHARPPLILSWLLGFTLLSNAAKK